MEGLGGSHMGLGVRVAGQVQGKFLNLCTVAPFPPVSVLPSPFPSSSSSRKFLGGDSSNAGGLNLYLTKPLLVKPPPQVTPEPWREMDPEKSHHTGCRKTASQPTPE